MDEFKEFLIFLSQFDFTFSKFEQIVHEMGDHPTLKKFCKTKVDDKVLTSAQYDEMLALADKALVSNYFKNLQDKEVVVLTKYDDEYPDKLRYLSDSPFFLFCKGDLSLLNQPSIAVVGTRKPSGYGQMVTNKIVGDLATAGLVIISGLAYGLDSVAHRKTLEVGGRTIAVLGSGFNKIYPTEHESLADEIARTGLLVSEYPMSKIATKYTFPQRNRIISGLSDGVLITEASFKSGTILTKDYALEQGKNIYAVPGNIDSTLSQLTNDVIKSGQGMLVESAKDILDDFDLKVIKKNKSHQNNFSIEEEIIINILSNGAKEFDQIVKESGFNTNLVNSYLTTLEISGIICRLPGNLVTLN